MDIHVHPNKSACGHQSVSIRAIRGRITKKPQQFFRRFSAHHAANTNKNPVFNKF